MFTSEEHEFMQTVQKGICSEMKTETVKTTIEIQRIKDSERFSKQDEVAMEYNLDIPLKNGEVVHVTCTPAHLEEMILAARGRWKIENEGFNNQKNGIYDIEHLNSYDTNAMKNHYLLTQIADIIMQLYLAWNPLRKEIKQSIKNTSSRLLESFRGLTVTDEDVLTTSRYTTIYLE